MVPHHPFARLARFAATTGESISFFGGNKVATRARFAEKRVDPIVEDFHEAIEARNHDGQTHRHRFQNGQWRPLIARRHEQCICLGVELRHCIDVSEKMNVGRDAKIACPLLEHRMLSSGAGYAKRQIPSALQKFGGDVEEKREILLLMQTANAEDDERFAR